MPNFTKPYIYLISLLFAFSIAFGIKNASRTAALEKRCESIDRAIAYKYSAYLKGEKIRIANDAKRRAVLLNLRAKVFNELEKREHPNINL